tara:strand:+ start:97966 stop:98985 length:1020 start_codon:yes stop_codon:yes gene_type:complete
MIDLQTIYIRNVAELDDINIASMIRIENIDVSAVTDVLINGASAKFFPFGLDVLMVALPASFAHYQQLVANEALGTSVSESVNDIKVVRRYEGVDGAEYTNTEIVSWEDNALDIHAPYGSKRVTLDSGVLRLSGRNFDKVVRVIVNGKDQQFLIESGSSVLTSIPPNDLQIESVEVITTSEKVGRETFFDYLLGGDVNVVSGLFKMVQQFVKVLMTTPGTDSFNKSLGGNMQNWVGQTINLDNPQALVAKTIINVVQVATQIQIQQIEANVPVDERLSDVQVLDARLDPMDPSIMQMSLKLNTFAGKQAFFQMLVGQAKDQIDAAAASVNPNSATPSTS